MITYLADLSFVSMRYKMQAFLLWVFYKHASICANFLQHKICFSFDFWFNKAYKINIYHRENTLTKKSLLVIGMKKKNHIKIKIQ